MTTSRGRTPTNGAAQLEFLGSLIYPVAVRGFFRPHLGADSGNSSRGTLPQDATWWLRRWTQARFEASATLTSTMRQRATSISAMRQPATPIRSMRLQVASVTTKLFTVVNRAAGWEKESTGKIRRT